MKQSVESVPSLSADILDHVSEVPTVGTSHDAVRRGQRSNLQVSLEVLEKDEIDAILDMLQYGFRDIPA